ncbi:MAG: arginase [Kurthia gibsonii]|uniref:arginase n=1 Tax=Kurthia TaxID=1649 RepID=UPI000745B0A9|nr:MULTISPECIES: arginase [Kurthia]MCA9724031.1 arginase [Kurthia sp.]AMA62049.1 arginase [Kurthia sp. 11kri321]MEB7773023.1 arginase [Kurthia gibsonii]RXH51628.1 arginase [Kurthia gibsonii]WIL38521.1 arginase [Kurthia sp. YJT4]
METLNISMIGVPIDFGQMRRGVDMGPSAIRYAGAVERLEALGHEVVDEGDIYVPNAAKLEVHPKLRNLGAVVEACTKLAEQVATAVEHKKFPLVLGGDHSIAIGTLAGLAQHYKNLGVIWYDAHADMNTAETSPSGNIHGMPLAVAMGLGHEKLTHIGGEQPKIDPKNLVIIGARSVDEGERELIKEKGIKVYSMHEIDRLGMAAVMEDALAYLRSREIDGLHLSLDLDGLDPMYTPGVGTPVPGGITYRESHLAMEMLQESNLLTSAEFVEVNPVLDTKNATANVAVGLMGSLLGESLV